MTYGSGNKPDPSQEQRGSEPTWEYQQGEIVAQEHPGIDVPIPSGRLPVPASRPAPSPPVVVKRRTMAVLLSIVAVLVLIVAVLLVLTLGSGNKALVAAGQTSNAGSPSAGAGSASASATPGASVSGSAGPGASPTGGGSAASASASGPAQTSAGPNSSFSPVFGTRYLAAPVDGSGVYTQVDVHISNVDYPNSVRFYCPTSGMVDWDVAGYSTFTAMFGIPDDAQYATGITNTMTFSDQNGRSLGAVKTSIGQPMKISFNLNGVVRLVISCARQGSNESVNNLVALGDATVSTS